MQAALSAGQGCKRPGDVCTCAIYLIAEFGLERVREPHVKHLEGKLWEMRLKGRGGIARALYLTASGKRIVILRAFRKKNQKTPRREIELALKRAEEIE